MGVGVKIEREAYLKLKAQEGGGGLNRAHYGNFEVKSNVS